MSHVIGEVTDTNYHLFQNIFIWGSSRVAIFVDIIRIVTMFIKTIFKDLKSRLNKKGNYVSKSSLYLHLLI